VPGAQGAGISFGDRGPGIEDRKIDGFGKRHGDRGGRAPRQAPWCWRAR
jgi:hypothetical protein